jgi:6-phosphogluconolactonase (cycloisomerase 2 family)
VRLFQNKIPYHLPAQGPRSLDRPFSNLAGAGVPMSFLARHVVDARRFPSSALLFWMGVAALLLLLILSSSPVSALQPCPLSSVHRSVTICRPVTGVTYDSPIRILAGASHVQPVLAMQVYLDGSKVYQATGDVADTNLVLKPGTHHLVVQARDAAGTFQQGMDVAVRTRLYPRAAYVANANDQTLSVYAMEANSGFLRQNGYVLAGDKPSAVVETWRGFVYATGGTSGKLHAYRKSGGGRLLPLPGSPYSCGTDCRALAVDAAGKFVYVADYAAGAILGFAINPTTGALTAVAAAPSVTGSHPTAAVISCRNILFVTNEASNNLSAFAIDPVSGALTPVPGMPFVTGNAPRAVAVDPFGYYLYVANYEANTISTFRIAVGGALTELGPAMNVGSGPSSIAMYPSGAFLYVTHALGNTVKVFKLDINGALHPAGTFSTGPQPTAIAMDAQGRYALVAHAGAPYELWEYAIDLSSGALKFARGTRTRGTGVALAVASATAPMAFAPGFLYAGTVNQSNLSGKIFAFNITSTGALAAVAGSPYATLNGTIALAPHPTGTILYAPALKPPNLYTGIINQYWVNRSTGALTVAAPWHNYEEFECHYMVLDPSGRFAYATSGNGVMEPWFTGVSVPAAGGPLMDWLFYPGSLPWTHVAIDPTGKFAYRDGQVFGFGGETLGIDALTGELFYEVNPEGPFGGVTVDPSGRFAYGLVSDQIASYYVSGRNGALTQVGSALPAGSAPAMIAVDPYGRFVYVANKNSNNISAYKANSGNGVLTPVAGQPYAAGTAPVALNIDITGNYLYAVNEISLDVTAYKMNQTTGALTALAGSPFHLLAPGVATSLATIGKIN